MEFFSYFRFRLNIYHEFQIPYTGVHKYIQDKELYESPIKFWSFSSINVSWSRHINAVISSFNDHENHSRSFPLSKKSRCPFLWDRWMELNNCLLWYKSRCISRCDTHKPIRATGSRRKSLLILVTYILPLWHCVWQGDGFRRSLRDSLQRHR